MATRLTVGWCHYALEFIGMSIVHIGVVDEAGLDGLPEQGLFMCFKQSEIEVIDVNMFILVVDCRVFLKGVVFSSAFNCVFCYFQCPL